MPVAELRPGDEIELRPGARVPVDGVILAGQGSVDESPVTGEALPVLRAPGAPLLAGTLNLDGVLRLRVTSAPGASFLDRMARLIEGAQADKPPVQRLADQMASVFVPVVVALALLTCAAWLLHGAGYPRAILNAVSVMVIACPCALGLATPAAILAGTKAGAQAGILFRDAAALERAARVDLLAFDKTGTLTTGQPRLREVAPSAGWMRRRRALSPPPWRRRTRIPSAWPCAGPAWPRRRSCAPCRGRGSPARWRGGPSTLRRWADAPGTDDASWSCLAGADGVALAAFAFTDSARPGAARRLPPCGPWGWGCRC